MPMNFYFNSNNIVLAGGGPDPGFPTFAVFAVGIFLVIAGNIGLILAFLQKRRGKVLEGLQSLRQSVIAICVGGAAIGYSIVSWYLSFPN
jgi:hypothetical protein